MLKYCVNLLAFCTKDSLRNSQRKMNHLVHQMAANDHKHNIVIE